MTERFQIIPPLNGLVLAGGRSLRMKIDKATLCYHDKTQSEHCFELLSSVCQKVFLSNRKEQASDVGHRGLPQLHDQFMGSGPLVGILTAMKLYPETAWLVLACDMPFVDAHVIEKLVMHRDPAKNATAFAASDGKPEPLCAIYEPGIFRLLMSRIQDDRLSPRSALMDADISLVQPDQPSSLENINFFPQSMKAVERVSQ